MQFKNSRRLSTLCLFLTLSACSFADTYAVVVGVNDYPDPTDAAGNPMKDENGKVVSSKLRGAVNDAVDVRDLLISKYGVTDSHIKLLLDKDANGDGFIAAMKASIGSVHKGDQFIFYFSGHGTRMKDETSKDSDGKGSAIVLQDIQCVRGKLFGELAHSMADQGISSTFIFDSCFSGGMSRAGDIYGFKKARNKAVSFERLGAKAIVVDSKVAPLLAMAGMHKGLTEDAGKFAFIYASQYDVTSIDLGGSADGTQKAHGLFTIALTAVLKDAPQGPVGEIVDAIKMFFDKTFEGKDIKQRPSDEFSDLNRAKDPIVYKPAA